MKKLQCYFYDEKDFEEDSKENTSEEINTFVCEMNYVECNRRGYCNGDC